MQMRQSHRPRIAFVTIDDANKRSSWSGIPYYLSRQIAKHWGDVHYIGSLDDLTILRLVEQFVNRLAERGIGKFYRADTDPWLTRHYARQVERRLNLGGTFDLVFSPSTIPIADLKTDLPIVTYCDSTFAAMQDFYPEYSNLSRATIRNGHQLERKAVQNATLLVYASDWAADAAITHYGAPREKVQVAPFGANLDQIPPREVAEHRNIVSPCRLLWIGRAWYRKGGDTALKIWAELIKEGIPSILTIVGCIPPVETLPDNVVVIPYLDKQSPQGNEDFDRLMTESDFMVLPTRADCSPIAIAEVNAYGMPAIASAVGGIPSILKDGVNGFTMSPEATPKEYADRIADIWNARDKYKRLARTSRETFEGLLNWDVTVQKIAEFFWGWFTNRLTL
jgi:glycosyltransferase involved in cell wall biosynthesis